MKVKELIAGLKGYDQNSEITGTEHLRVSAPLFGKTTVATVLPKDGTTRKMCLRSQNRADAIVDPRPIEQVAEHYGVSVAYIERIRRNERKYKPRAER